LQPQAEHAISRSDLVILTHGVGVTDGDRASLYPQNRQVMREMAIPALRGFAGILFVVSNPVELLAQLIWHEAALEHCRVLGLGTLVETARARAALADYLSPIRPARNIPIFAVGTHDEHVVLQLDGDQGLPRGSRDRVLARVHHEVVRGAKRVKEFADATLHPVVEATIEIVRAIAHDSRTLLPVATLDEDEGLFYSVPCIIGQAGVHERRAELLDDVTREGLARGTDAMRAVLHSHPD
jgi:L-lactate dehydrogenase